MSVGGAWGVVAEYVGAVGGRMVAFEGSGVKRRFAVELTTLAIFLKRSVGTVKEIQSKASVSSFVLEMRSLTITNASIGTSVMLRNLKSRRELIGKKDLISGSVKVSCISLTCSRRQYRLHGEPNEYINIVLQKAPEVPTMTNKEKIQLYL